MSNGNRATLGGMINSDASWQGSLQYGKTSDHVLSLQAVLAGGSVLESDISGAAPVKGTTAAHALAVTERVCREKRDQMMAKFPDPNRFITGYDLKNAFYEDSGRFNLTSVLCGAEGSLAFITEATLNLTLIHQARTPVIMNYQFIEKDMAS